MELARRAKSAVLRSAGVVAVSAADFAEVYAESDRRDSTPSASRRRNCANGRNVYAGDWEFLRWPVCFTCRANSLSFGAKNFRLCDSGSATPPHASRRKCSATIAIFDLSAASSLTTIKSRSRKNCCNIRSRRRAFAKKTFVSFSMKRRTLSRRNFLFCWKRRDRRLRPAIGWKRKPIRRARVTSAWWAIFSNRFTGSART